MDNTVIVALITGLLGFATSIIVSYKSLSQSKKIEKLKKDLEVKKEADTQILRFLLTYETEIINQSFIALKDYLSTAQKIKDQLRDITLHYNSFFKNDLENSLSALKSAIVEKYSNSVYYFDRADVNKNAHSLKNIVLEIYDVLISSNPNFDHANNLLNDFSNKQENLQKEMDNEINKLLNAIKP